MEFFGVEALISQNSSGVNPYSSGVSPYFMEVFRGECNFRQSSEIRRKSKSSTGGGGGGGPKLKKNSPLLMIQINVCIINPVVIEFQMWIFAILCYSWLIMIKFCVLLRTRPGKSQMLLLKNDISHKFWLFCSRHCVYIWPLWLFVFFFVIWK